MAQSVGAQVRLKVAKISKHALIVTSPTETPHRKHKTFLFRFQVEDLLNPWMVWIAQSAGELCSCKNLKSRVKKWPVQDLKGQAWLVRYWR